MSFSLDIKKELSKTANKKKCCDIAELAGITAFCGSLKYKDNGMDLKLSTESIDTALRAIELLMDLNYDEAELTENNGIGGAKIYYVTLSQCNRLLDELKFVDRANNLHCFRISGNYFKIDCCRRSFCKGAFLGGGSITNPEKNYRIEFVTHHKRIWEEFGELLKAFNITPKKTVRNSSYVIYVTGANETEDLINLIGAHKSLMELVNIRILKEHRNNVNRRSNCDIGNLNKVVNAATEQRRAIQKIKQAKKFESLPKTLKDLAILREEYPENSLSDLGQMLEPPLSRSGVNHRLQKLIEIANQIDEKEGKDNE